MKNGAVKSDKDRYMESKRKMDASECSGLSASKQGRIAEGGAERPTFRPAGPQYWLCRVGSCRTLASNTILSCPIYAKESRAYTHLLNDILVSALSSPYV
jgi:hypothetical protein